MMTILTPLSMAIIFAATNPAPSLSDIVALGDAVTPPPVPALAEKLNAASTAPALASRSEQLLPLAANIGGENEGGLKGTLKTWLLLGLALAAGVVALKSRKRLGPSRDVHVLERVTLSKGREIVLVRVVDDTLLLSSSDTGVSVLREGVRLRATVAPATTAPRSWMQHLTDAVQGRVPNIDDGFDAGTDTGFGNASMANQAVTSAEDNEIRRRLANTKSARPSVGPSELGFSV